MLVLGLVGLFVALAIMAALLLVWQECMSDDAAPTGPAAANR